MRDKSDILRQSGHCHLLWRAAIVVLAAWFGLSGCQVGDAVGTNVQRALEATGLDRDDEQGLDHASGTIQADEVRIASEYGGRIVEIHAPVGKRVQAGELVVLLDASALVEKLTEAEAAVALLRQTWPFSRLAYASKRSMPHVQPYRWPSPSTRARARPGTTHATRCVIHKTSMPGSSRPAPRSSWPNKPPS